MWFKQIQLFQLAESLRSVPEELTKKLEALAFQECLPSMPYGSGWIAPVEEDEAPLVQTINHYMMICLQVEEKILPPIVIRQELAKKVKQIESLEKRQVSPREKYALKSELASTLLLRAFSKLTRVYAYIDPRNRRLVLGTANPKKTEQFLSAFRKTFGETIEAFQIKKLAGVMTAWLKHEEHPSSFSIEKACVLQDANHESRVIRCKEQDLFASSIQSLIKEGCEIIQLALNWQDRIDFMLLSDLSLQSIRFKDEVIEQVKEMEAGTKQQQFNADLFMMSETLDGLLRDLLGALDAKKVQQVVPEIES